MNSICNSSSSSIYRARDLGQNRLQVQLLAAISDCAVMSDVVFHGGSSLLLCYDGVRLSEDLDFSSPSALTLAQYGEVTADALERLSIIYGAPATATPLKHRKTDSGLTVSRFHVRCESYEHRPDIPKLDVKLEFTTVPSYTRVTRSVAPIFEEPVHLPFLTTEALDEQLANKAIAVTSSPYLRYRDLWDVFFLTRPSRHDLTTVRQLFAKKMSDYGVAAFDVRSGLDRIRREMLSDEGVAEWQRSIVPRLIDSGWAQRLNDLHIASSVISEALVIIEDICEDPPHHQFKRGR